MPAETDIIETVASLMALSARTAPKGKGIDALTIKVITGGELQALADEMRRYGEANNISFFIRDSGNIAASAACVIVGAEGNSIAGLNCGGCGFRTCEDMLIAQEKAGEDDPFKGPNCVIRMADLGIAVGSAVKTASIHNVDNRVMYSAGVAALSLGWLPGCNTALAIPLSGYGKNIFFDRK